MRHLRCVASYNNEVKHVWLTVDAASALVGLGRVPAPFPVSWVAETRSQLSVPVDAMATMGTGARARMTGRLPTKPLQIPAHHTQARSKSLVRSLRCGLQHFGYDDA